jgi:hypothetical protein
VVAQVLLLWLLVFVIGFWEGVLIRLKRSPTMLFWGDNHGRETVVGRRDVNWARGNSTMTDILLLSAVWPVGFFFC